MNQLKERPPDSSEDSLNAAQIEKLLEKKYAKAKMYASDPSRFILSSLELELRSTHGNRLIIYQVEV
jgi:hypothetical protein